MTELDKLIESAGKCCPKCDGAGWLYFRCGTPWRCECNPYRPQPIRQGLPLYRAHRATITGADR